MTKVNIVDKIYEMVRFPRKKVAKIVEAVFDIMKETLRREDEIKISGFGNFVVKNKRARRGRNPQTGDSIEIKPRRVLTFKSSVVFRAKINARGINDTKI